MPTAFQTRIATAAGDASYSGRCRILGFYVTAGVDAATVTINDALTAAGGGTTLEVGAGIGLTEQMMIPGPGLVFQTGLSIASTGTTPTVGVFYAVE